MKKSYTIAKLLILFIILIQSQGAEAQTLKSLAEAQGKYIGNLMRDGLFDDFNVNNGQTNSILTTEYNATVAGNRLKMSNLLGTRPLNPFNIQIADIDTDIIDRFINYADSNNLRKRGHVMIWFKGIPNWLQTEASSWSAQQVYDFSTSYVKALATYTQGKIDEWDVLNEAVVSSGFRSNTWYDIVATQANDDGKIGYQEYFAALFNAAYQGDPTGSFYYNDFEIEAFGSQKNTKMLNLVNNLKNMNVPIDGVGFQSHFTLGRFINDSQFVSKVQQTMASLNTSGLMANITELDIRICNEKPISQTSLNHQKTAYKDYVSMAIQQENCNTVMLWGISDNDSWIPFFDPNCGFATPHNSNFEKKPAYFGIKEALQEALALKNGTVNEIKVVDAPNEISAGSTITASITYEAVENMDIVFVIRPNSSPKTTIKAKRVFAKSGVGVLNINLDIPESLSILENGYEFFTLMLPAGEQSWSQSVDRFTKGNISIIDSQPPSAISALTASNISVSSFDLSWEVATDNVAVTEYDIYVDEALYGSTSASSFELGSLSSGKTYAVSVIAKDANDNESISATIDVTTNLPTSSLITSVSSSLFLLPNQNNTVSIDYQANESREILLVFREIGNTSNVYFTKRSTVAAGIGSEAFTITTSDLSSISVGSRLYEYAVYIVPVGGDRNSSFSSKFKSNISIVDVFAPSVPSGFTATNITPTSFEVFWVASTDNVGVTAYEVTINGVLETVTTTSYTATGLSPETLYTVNVSAKDNKGLLSETGSFDVTTVSSGKILSIDGPTTVEIGATITVPVTYTAFDASEIVVSFKRDNSPRTTYNTVRTSVNAGQGIANVVLNIPENVPFATEDYEYQVYIVPVGGDWNARYDNKSQSNITVSNPNKIAAISSSLFLLPNQNNTVSVDYQANESRDILLVFRETGNTSNEYFTKRSTVDAGIGSEAFTISSSDLSSISVGSRLYEYAVYIVPVGGDRNSSFSSKFKSNISIVDVFAPSVPSGFTATNITPTSFEVSWAASTDNVGVTAYEVEINGVLETVTTTSYLATGLSPETLYTVNVSAKDNKGLLSETGSFDVTTVSSGKILSIDGPTTVEIGATITIPVTYTAFDASEIVLSFKRDNSPRTTYNTVRMPVNAGQGIANVVLNIPENVPFATEDYEYQVYIVPVGGDWNARYDNKSQSNITVSNPNKITAISSSLFLLPNQNNTVSVDYDVKESRDILLVFRETGNTSNVYFTKRSTVAAGIGSEAITITTSDLSSISVGSRLYEYAVYIVPIGGDRNSSFSSKFKSNISIVDVFAPSVPSGFTATNITPTSFEVSWAASTDNVGVTAYEVTINGVLEIITTTSYTATGLSPETLYAVNVSAKDNKGLLSETGSFDVTTVSSGKILSIDGPTTVEIGTTITVPVTYTAFDASEIVVSFKRDNLPRTTYNTVRTSVNAGQGIANVVLDIPENVPVATEDYEYLAYIVSTGGDWNARFDHKSQSNISVIENIPEVFFIKNKGLGTYIFVENSSDGALIKTGPKEETNYYKWQKIVIPNSAYFHFKNVQTGKFFRPKGKNEASFIEQRPESWNGNFTKWREVLSSDGTTFHLQNKETGFYIRTNSTDVVNLRTAPTRFNGSWERWTYEITTNSNNSSAKNKGKKEKIEDSNLVKNNEILVYPNPVKNKLFVKNLSEVKQIAIFSVIGRKMISNVKDIDSEFIDMSSYPNGFYILRFLKKDGTITSKKILKE